MDRNGGSVCLRNQQGEALNIQSLPKGIRSALTLLGSRLSLHSPTSHLGIFKSLEEKAAFESEVLQCVGTLGLPKYIYHGTIAGRLESILLHGLLPGKVPVWTGSIHDAQRIRGNSDSGVFFSDSWRTAMFTWAYIAHAKSRGPKQGQHRRPTVIRIKAEGLELVRDEMAAGPGNWKATGAIALGSAEVISGLDTAFAEWMPLKQFAMTLPGKAVS